MPDKARDKIFELAEFDKFNGAGRKFVVGVDEAGRGALAGPVCAAAAAIKDSLLSDKKKLDFISELDDSKKLSPEKREEILKRLTKLKSSGDLDFEAAFASVEEIESLNILNATALAMERAVSALNDRMSLGMRRSKGADTLFGEMTVDLARATLLVDGKPMKKLPFAHMAVVKGDGKSLAIAAASIVAKVSRDNFMALLAPKYPRYDFAKHKGYGTALHLQELLVCGASSVHRKSFLKKLREDYQAPKQSEFEL